MRTTNKILLTTVFALALISPTTVQAAVLTFDTDQTGISGDFGALSSVSPNYGGLVWEDMYAMRSSSVFLGTGYEYGRLSGDYVAYNFGGYPATISVGDPEHFDFVGTYITAAWENGLTVEATAYLDGVLVGSESIVLSATQPTWWQVDFNHIDELVFTSGGSPTIPNKQFAMDNFTYNLPSASVVPIPAPAALGLLGMGLVASIRRRKKSAQV